MEQFDKEGGYSHAFLCTYNFAPGFFEERILKTKAFRSCPYIAILIDEAKYQELCHDPKGGRLINRRYMLVPVKMPRSWAGVFHPKLWFLSGKDHAQLFVGSSNLSRSGITSNLEMVSSFAYTKGDKNKSPTKLFRSAYEFLQAVATGYCSYSDTLKQAIKQLHALSPVLSEKVNGEGNMDIIHSLDSSILEQFLINQELTSAKLTVLSPYFDSNIGELLGVIAERIPLSSVNIIVQQNTNTLNVESLKQWHNNTDTDLTIQLLSAPGRKLHAKALILESPDGKTCTSLIGSANFTKAALLKTANTDGNIELCLTLKGDMAQSVRKSMQSGVFSTQEVSLEDVRSSLQDDNWTAPETKIKLYHAELDSKASLIKTVCQVDENVSESILDYNLLVKKIGSASPDTVCKVAHTEIEKGILDFSVGEEDSSILSKATTVAIHARTADEELLSNYVWLLNITEMHASLDRDYKKIAKQFRESGKGLIEFINNYVEHGMIDKAIDLLARLDIRFNNGGRGIITRAIIRMPSSPITDDDATELIWRLTSDQRGKFATGISDFILRHHQKVLKRHIKKPNLNGLDNFFDVMETCADLAITALKNGIMTASDVHKDLLFGLRLFAGDTLTEGYFRALWRKFYDVKDRFQEALIRHKICERTVAYALLLKTIDTRRNANKVGFIRLADICDLTTTDYLDHFFEFVGIGEGFCDRVAAVLMESYDNSDYCRVEFNPIPKNPYFDE